VATASQLRLAVTDIDHVGINVPDVNAVSAFFADLLGAGVVSDMRPGSFPTLGRRHLTGTNRARSSASS
jgi:catechol 2,3-dioxygenase-like lactoylglutathione lyase family enzyme